jgi:cation diffusion facilitator family transporter
MIGAPAKATPKTAVQREALSFAGSCLALNAAMVVLKTVVGVFAGSHALLASAMYSVNDVLTSIAVLLSLEIGNRKPDRSHPYGYTKAEYIAAGMVSLVIAVGVFFMFFFSVLDILRGVPGPPHFIAMSLAAVSMIASWAIARRGHKLSHKLRSPVLATHSKHHHADAEGSLLAIIGVAGALMGFHTFDRIIAVVETLHLIALSGALLARSVKGLMDTSMASEDIDLVRHACLEVEGVHDIAHIRSRQAGRDTWVDVAVAVGSKLDVLEAGRICNNVGSAVRGVLGSNVVAQVRFQGPSFVYESPGPGGSPHG